MRENFLQTTLGSTGFNVHRIGLSATYRPNKKTVYKAVDRGINYFFALGIDTQMFAAMNDVFRNEREKFILATGVQNIITGHKKPGKILEKRLRQFKTDYIDIFMLLGIKDEKHLEENALEELSRMKEQGKVRAIGISTHHRKSAGKLAEEGKFDVFMIRYNAAHRGAENDIFPYLANYNPGIVSFTATRWRALSRRPRGYPEGDQIPPTGMAYRFVLSNPHIHVCMMAPRNLKQFEQNMVEIEKGPLNEEEIAHMREFGDAVYKRNKRFR